TLHRPVPLLYEPRLGVADTKFSPAGSKSATATLVATFGPRLLNVTVKVMLSPTLGAALLTALVNARSDCCGVSCASDVLVDVMERMAMVNGGRVGLGGRADHLRDNDQRLSGRWIDVANSPDTGAGNIGSTARRCRHQRQARRQQVGHLHVRGRVGSLVGECD